MYNIYDIKERPTINGPDEQDKWKLKTPVPISQTEWEFNILLELYKSILPENVLEIGTHYGGTLYHWIKNSAHLSKIVTVDNYQLNEKLYPIWMDNLTTKVTSIKGNSQDEATIEKIYEYGPYDWIFIDGGHMFSEVSSDWATSINNINPGGVIALHDILPQQNAQVDELWRAIQHMGHVTQEIIADDSLTGIGVVYL